MFLVSVILFFFLGGSSRCSSASALQPGPFFLDALATNRMFTLHGVV